MLEIGRKIVENVAGVKRSRRNVSEVIKMWCDVRVENAKGFEAKKTAKKF
jgi:hypothetical protein